MVPLPARLICEFPCIACWALGNLVYQQEAFREIDENIAITQAC